MRLVVLAALALAAFGAPASAADQSPQARVLGSWKSDERFNGEPRVVIDLKDEGGQIAGGVVMHGVTDDDNNQTTMRVAISEAKLDGDSLSFKTKGQDESFTEWVMTFSEDNKAVASMVGDSDGPYSDPQKWRMKRDAAR